MAYIEEQDPKKQLVPGAPSTTNQGSTLAGSGGTASPGAASPTATSTPGSGFTNLDQYLTANKGQGAGVANEINAAGNVAIEPAKTAATTLAGQYEAGNSAAVAAGRAPADEALKTAGNEFGLKGYQGPETTQKSNELETAYTNVNNAVDTFGVNPYGGQSALQKNHGYGNGFAALDNFIGRQDGRATINQWEKDNKSGNAQSSYDKGNAEIAKTKAEIKAANEKRHGEFNREAWFPTKPATEPPPPPPPPPEVIPPAPPPPPPPPVTPPPTAWDDLAAAATKAGDDTIAATTKAVDDTGSELERARKGTSIENAGKTWDTAVNDVEAAGEQVGKDFSIENINTQVGDALDNTYDAADKFINQDLSINNIADTIDDGLSNIGNAPTDIIDSIGDLFGKKEPTHNKSTSDGTRATGAALGQGIADSFAAAARIGAEATGVNENYTPQAMGNLNIGIGGDFTAEDIVDLETHMATLKAQPDGGAQMIADAGKAEEAKEAARVADNKARLDKWLADLAAGIYTGPYVPN
jgi:hypothetical protein